MSCETIALPAPHSATNSPAPVRSTPCSVTELTRDEDARWDRYVHTHPDGTLFHTLAWRDAVKHSFGHADHYLIAKRDGNVIGVLPIFTVASVLAGRMLVSVPYGVGGGIIADDSDAIAALFSAAKRIAEKHHCRCIDLRSERAVVSQLPTVQRYVGFRRSLPDNAADVLRWLPRKARAAARNGRRKYRLKESYSSSHLATVWRLYTLSMRRLASLNYPYSFFERLIALTPGRHWVSVVEYGRRPVAGLVTFLFKDRVMPYFIGTTSAARECSAANFIYLCAMERGVEEGYRVFDFGRSRRENIGSYDFKRFHGFEPQALGYQWCSLGKPPRVNLSPDDPKFRHARRLWRGLPLFVTRPLGSQLSRHIPG